MSKGVKRKKIKFSDEEIMKLIEEQESEDWQIEETETIYTDLEKGYSEIDAIVCNKEGEYFRITYYYSPYHEITSERINTFPIEGEQVFPKEIKVIVYE